MSEQKANLEEVRNAYENLVRLGKTGSAANVLKITGGSKSTVVKLLRIVRAEKVNQKPELDVPSALLHAVSEPLVRKIWEAASEMAIKLHQERINNLTTMLDGMLADLEAYEAAEDRVSELEAQLSSRDDFEGQLRALKTMVAELGGVRGEQAEPRQPTTLLMAVLNILLSSHPEPVSKFEIDSQMLAAGHKEAASQKARWHVVDKGYATTDGEALRLTDAGEQKVRPLQVSA
jgi:hypothetical protein